MKISIRGVAELADFEDLMLNPYLDSGGVKTVGIGSTSSDIKDLASWSWTKEISIKEAIDIYIKSLNKYENLVNNALKVKVSQNQYDALVSFVYNTGSVNNSVFRAVNSSASSDSVRRALLLWVNDNGKRVQGLVNRRNKEADLYETGVYKSNGCCDLIQVNPQTHKPIYNTAKRINLADYIDNPTQEESWIDIIANYFGYQRKP